MKSETRKIETSETTIDALARAWGVSHADAADIYERLDCKHMLAGESITHAGTIDNDDANKLSGHNGYWAVSGEYIGMITNGDPVWSTLNDEDICTECGLSWGVPAEMLAGNEL